MKLLVILSLFINHLYATTATVVDYPIIKSINRHWSHSPLFERQNHNSKIKIKLFQRVLWVGNSPVQVAQTNFTYLTNPQEKVDLKQLNETMLKSFPKGVLRSKQISNGYRLEGEWKQINRMLKIDIIKKNNDFMTVTTLYRPSISRSFTAELEEFHSLLKSYEENPVVKTSYINLLINDLQAAPTTVDLTGLTTLLTTTNPTSGTTPLVDAQTALGNGSGLGIGGITDKGMTNLGNGMSDLGTSLAPLAPAIDHQASATNNMADALRETNATINRQGDQANKTALAISAETNATINRQGDAFNKNYAETNRIAALALNPDHMAKLAFYTAAGAALGSLTVNLAVEGIAAGFSFLKEFFTGEKEKAIDWDKFQKAITAWDGQVNNLANYEKVVDDLIFSFNFFQNKKMNDDYLSNLEKTKLEMKFDEKEELALSEAQNLSRECRFKHYEIADYLHSKIEEYSKILKFANDQHIKIDDNQKYFCQQLAELKQRILQAEQQMADLRFSILKAERQFYEKSIDMRDQRIDDVDKINSQFNRTLKAQQNFDKENSQQLADFEDKTQSAWMTLCMSKKNDEGKKIEEEKLLAMKKGDLKYLIAFNFKSNCERKYKQTHEEIKRDQNVHQDLLNANILRKNIEIDGNVNVDLALSEEQQKWFTRIHMDAHCYPFAHGPEDSIPKECKEFPEMLSSLRLSKGADKAQAAYKENCQSQYAEGLKKLASH